MYARSEKIYNHMNFISVLPQVEVVLGCGGSGGGYSGGDGGCDCVGGVGIVMVS